MNSIISWNVNGIRAVEKKGFLDWLNTENPDVLCVQETKAAKAQLSKELTEPDLPNGKYFAYWASAKKAGYSGTAIFTKKEPLQVRTMGLKEFDDEGRVLVADFDKVSIISAYFPNSQGLQAGLLCSNSRILRFCTRRRKQCNSLRGLQHSP